MVHSHEQYQFVFVGNLSRDFIITSSGKMLNDIPGGNVLYTAANAGYWEKGNIGIVAKAGSDFPEEWIKQIHRNGFDTRGIRRDPNLTDSRFFISFHDNGSPVLESPLLQYSKLGCECPSSLLGYSYPNNYYNVQNPLLLRSIGISEIPPEYLNTCAAHICPLDHDSQKVVSQLLQYSRVNTITLEPSASFMVPSSWADIAMLVDGLTAFIVAEGKLRNLFSGKTADLWVMAETIACFGCEIVVVRLSDQSQFLYEHPNHTRWSIPAYPNTIINPRGAGASFCGGFLAGFRKSYSPLEAAIMGNISASLSVEGDNPFYIMDTIPALGAARVDALRKMIKKL